MTMYVRVVAPLALTVSSPDHDNDVILDGSRPTAVLPLWAAQKPEFQQLWAAGKVQVSTSPAFSTLITSIPSSELPTGGGGTQGIQGEQGIQGIQGVQGIPGEQGPPGVSIDIEGTVATYADLPASPLPGQAFVVAADGKLYFFDGTAFPADGQGVPFRGPQGVQGVQGIQGEQGIQGIQGIQGPPGSGGSGGGSLWECADLGFKGWAFDPQIGTDATQAQSATWYLTAVKVPQDCTVSNIYFWCTTTGTTITEFYAGLYSTNPADTVEYNTTTAINQNFNPVSLLGRSSNVTTVSTSLPTAFPLPEPISLTAGVYQVAWYCNATTRPSILRAYSQSNLSMGRGKMANTSMAVAGVFPTTYEEFGGMSNQSSWMWAAVS